MVNPRKVQTFRRFAVLTTVATYLLIFVGGLVRVSGAGMGCPDWPKCFGRWIPPTNASQLPASMDSALFNFTLAWIEYVNRLVGVMIGLLIFILAVLALRNFRQHKRIMYPSGAALALVAYQGWQGSRVVSSGLEPLLITVHMVLAFVIVSILIYVALQAYYIEHPDAETKAQYPKLLRKLVMGLYGLTILQVILGTQVRSVISRLEGTLPLAGEATLLSQANPVSYLHGLFGVAVAAFTWFVGDRILRLARQPSGLVRAGAKVMIGLVLAQIVIGGILVGFELPNLMQLYHLWTASLFIGVLFIIFTSLKRGETSYD